MCDQHGEFLQTPAKHLSGQGCPKCGIETLRKCFVSNSEEFVSRARTIHGDIYDYTKVLYKNALTKVEIICPLHGSFLQTPSVHMSSGCGICGHERTASAKFSNTSEFIRRAGEVHGEKFDYSRVEYVRNNIDVEILCREHGVFSQTPSNHLAGQGCARCATSGYSTEKGGYLYVMGTGNTLKIGITNRSVITRLKELRKASCMPFTILYTRFFENGEIPKLAETKLLRQLRDVFEPLDAKFSGSTECFIVPNNDDFSKCVDKIVAEVSDEY